MYMGRESGGFVPDYLHEAGFLCTKVGTAAGGTVVIGDNRVPHTGDQCALTNIRIERL